MTGRNAKALFLAAGLALLAYPASAAPNALQLFGYNAWCHFTYAELKRQGDFKTPEANVAGDAVIADTKANYERHMTAAKAQGTSALLMATMLQDYRLNAPAEVAAYLSGKPPAQFIGRYIACRFTMIDEEPIPFGT